ncbi:MAG: family 20 glycosylhydrolase [Phycisphaerae bacterium]|nr:family 20 glycosylhydrolase [Phycisphaerae bacterium]
MPDIQHLIPVRKTVSQRGRFRIPAKVVLATARPADDLPLEQLSNDITAIKGLKVRVVHNAFGPATVRVSRDAKISNVEGYRIVISPDGVEIFACTDAGVYYGIQTLRELLRIHGRSLPACRIDDQPDFRRRGVYLDCSRGKVPKLSTIKTLIERLAHWKINELQLYIENVFTFSRHPAIGKGYSPLTPEDILAIQEECKRYHISLVPSLASFGHMERILALPEHIHLAELPGTHKCPGGTTLCPSDPGSIRLIEKLYEEFLPLFEADDFNVCCDETWELGKGRSKRRADRIGVGRVYLDFLKKIHRLCQKHGKRMNAWADIVLEHPDLLGDMPKDIVMLNWDYDFNGVRIPRSAEIAESGLPFMVCPGTSGWLTHGTNLPTAIGNVSQFAAAGRKWGAEGMLNTDWGDCGHRNTLGVSLHGFAHGAAHSWNGRGVDDKTFTRTFCFHVFGQRDGKLSRAVETLGSTYKLDSGHYRTLVEALDSSKNFGSSLDPVSPINMSPHLKSGIDAANSGNLRKIISKLSNAAMWTVSKKGLDEFEKLVLEEYALAARMDVLACKRALAGKKLRAGKNVPSTELKQLAKETQRMAENFRTLWLARNKPSRLRDNMKLFKMTAKECLQHGE